MPPGAIRLGAVLLGASAGAVAVIGLVTAGPGLPYQTSLLGSPRAEAAGPPLKTASLDAALNADDRRDAKTPAGRADAMPPVPKSKRDTLEEIAALEDVADEQRHSPLDSAQSGLQAGRAQPHRLAAVVQPARIQQINQRTVAVSKGDTLMKVLLKAGSDRRDAHAAVTALSSVYDLRRLMPGQTVTVAFREDGTAAASNETQLTDVVLRLSPERDAVARLNDEGQFTGQEIERELETRLQRASTPINDSLYLAAQREGVPPEIIVELIRLYSFDIDFQRDIQPNDSFEVLYESHFVEDGTLARHGDILYARLTVNGTQVPLYRYRTADGEVDYYNDKGHSVRKALMKTPIDGARLSSRFGKRRHPILGYTKMHRGVDFAAPRGTPVMAAGRGTVELAGWNGSYGRYVRIRHNGQYKTAYAHLSRLAKGVRSGSRVRQGQIIGYVGTTGRSTGPHLHYEVHANGRQINPLGLKLPTGRKLGGKELARFRDERSRLDNAFAALADKRQLANKE